MTYPSAFRSTLRVKALTQEITSCSLLRSIRINHFESGNKVLQRGIERPNVSIIKLDFLLAEPNKDSSEKQLRVGCNSKVGLPVSSSHQGVNENFIHRE